MNTIINTIKEMDEFIETHSECTLYVTEELNKELTRGLKVLSLGLSATPEQINLYFKVHDLTNKMLEKQITYKVNK